MLVPWWCCCPNSQSAKVQCRSITYVTCNERLLSANSEKSNCVSAPQKLEIQLPVSQEMPEEESSGHCCCLLCIAFLGSRLPSPSVNCVREAPAPSFSSL